MINRDRAWRRRTAKRVLHREEETREAYPQMIYDTSARPAKELKQHRHGALTHVQAMRLEGALGQEIREASEPI